MSNQLQGGVGFALVHAGRMEAIWLGRGVPDLSDALRVARHQLGWDAYSKDHPLTLDLEIWGCETRTVFRKYRRVWELSEGTESACDGKVLVERNPPSSSSSSELESTEILNTVEIDDSLDATH